MTKTEFERASIAETRRFRLHSARIGETFQLDVALPAHRGAPGQPLPVAYVMDANSVFGIAAQSARFLQQGDNAEPAILVGVGYCLDGIVRPRQAYGALRTRDFTPSIDQNYVDLITAAVQGRPIPEDIRPAGGADDFLEFLVEEVQPFIAENYSIDLKNQTLIGSSLGGLFGVYAFLRRPEAFAQYIVNSPALWWSGGEIMELPVELEPALGPWRMFMSVGGEEINTAPWMMLDNFRRFADRLRTVERLALTTHIFEDESHTSVIPAALSRGLRDIFACRS